MLEECCRGERPRRSAGLFRETGPRSERTAPGRAPCHVRCGYAHGSCSGQIRPRYGQVLVTSANNDAPRGVVR